MILDEDPDEDDDSDDIEKEDTEPAITVAWEFISDHWKLDQPKLIMSVVYDTEPLSVNQPLLKSLLSNLTQVAAAKQGRRSHKR